MRLVATNNHLLGLLFEDVSGPVCRHARRGLLWTSLLICAGLGLGDALEEALDVIVLVAVCRQGDLRLRWYQVHLRSVLHREDWLALHHRCLSGNLV